MASADQPEGLSAPSQGNAQTTRDGDLFVGWAPPYFSEFDPSGKLVFNAEFPTGVNTYRAYLLPWGTPRAGTGSDGPGGWPAVPARGTASKLRTFAQRPVPRLGRGRAVGHGRSDHCSIAIVRPSG